MKSASTFRTLRRCRQIMLLQEGIRPYSGLFEFSQCLFGLSKFMLHQQSFRCRDIFFILFDKYHWPKQQRQFL